MTRYRVSAIAGQRLDEIYNYTSGRWGRGQAESYVRGLFACFERIAARECAWRAIPIEFGVDGFYCRHKHHFIYWRILADDQVGIVTVLHQRMHQFSRFRDDVEP